MTGETVYKAIAIPGKDQLDKLASITTKGFEKFE